MQIFNEDIEPIAQEGKTVIHDGIPTNEERRNYFVNFQADNIVSLISHYHESWPNKLNGVLNEECLELARLYLAQLEDSKRSVRVDLDSKPHLKRIKYPHYLRYPQTMSQKYTSSLKGKLWDSCFVPRVLRDEDSLWYKRNFGSIDKKLPRKALRRKPRKTPPYCKDCGNRTFLNKALLEEHYKTTEHMIRRQEKLQDSLGLKGNIVTAQVSASHSATGQNSQNRSLQHEQPKEVPQSASIEESGESSNPPSIRPKASSLQSSNNRGTTPPAVAREGKRRCSDLESQEINHWNDNGTWLEDGLSNQQKELCFQFLVNSETGPKWNSVEDLTTVLALNTIFIEYQKGNTDELVWRCEKFGYVYDLRRKTMSRRNLTALRWGTQEVLDRSNTARFVTNLAAATLNHWCGYIESSQACPKLPIPCQDKSKEPEQIVGNNITQLYLPAPKVIPSAPVHNSTYHNQTLLSNHGVLCEPLTVVTATIEKLHWCSPRRSFKSVEPVEIKPLIMINGVEGEEEK